MTREPLTLDQAKDKQYKVGKNGCASFPSILVGKRVRFKNRAKYFYLIKSVANGCGYVSFGEKQAGLVLEIDEVAE